MKNPDPRLKKAAKTVLKKSGDAPKNISSVKSSSAVEKPAQPDKKNVSKTAKARSGTASGRTQLYVTLKVKPKTGQQPTETPVDLPFSYNKTQLVLLVRDPEWAYAYWDFSSETWNWIQSIFTRFPGSAPKMRIYNLSAGGYFDLDINLEVKNWYICLGVDNTEFEAELGILDSTGKFHVIVKSNRIKTPRSKPSDQIDPKWIPEHFDELYRLSGGGRFDGSSSAPFAVKLSS